MVQGHTYIYIYYVYILYIFLYNIKYKNINIYTCKYFHKIYCMCVYLYIHNIHSTHTYIYYVNKKVWHIFTIIATNNIFKQYNIIIICYVKIYNRINIQFFWKRHCLFYLFTENTRVRACVCACVRACVRACVCEKARGLIFSSRWDVCMCLWEKGRWREEDKRKRWQHSKAKGSAFSHLLTTGWPRDWELRADGVTRLPVTLPSWARGSPAEPTGAPASLISSPVIGSKLCVALLMCKC